MWGAVYLADSDRCHTPKMTDVVQTPPATTADTDERSRTGLSADALRRGILDHLRYSVGRPAAAIKPEHYYRATALAVRDRMQDNGLRPRRRRSISAARSPAICRRNF